MIIVPMSFFPTDSLLYVNKAAVIFLWYCH